MNIMLTECMYEHEVDSIYPRRVYSFYRNNLKIYIFINNGFCVEVEYKKKYINTAFLTNKQHEILKFVNCLFDILFTQYNIKDIIMDDNRFNKIIKRCENATK